MPTMKEVLWETIHNGKAKKTVDQLADEIGCSKSYLYRGALPYDEDGGSGCRFPLDFLLPVMLAQKDYSVLHHLAHDTGHLLVRISRGKALKPEGLNEFQKTFTKAFGLLLKFFDDPGAHDKQEVMEQLYKLMSETEGYRKAVEGFHQRELEFGDE